MNDVIDKWLKMISKDDPDLLDSDEFEIIAEFVNVVNSKVNPIIDACIEESLVLGLTHPDPEIRKAIERRVKERNSEEMNKQ